MTFALGLQWTAFMLRANCVASTDRCEKCTALWKDLSVGIPVCKHHEEALEGTPLGFFTLALYDLRGRGDA